MDSLWLVVHSMGSMADHGTMDGGGHQENVTVQGVLQRLYSLPCPWNVCIFSLGFLH